MTEETMTGSLLDDFQNTDASGSTDETMNMDTSDIYDEVVHPTGTECKLKIIAVEQKYSEKVEAKFWQIALEDASDPHVKRITHFLWFIGANDDVRKKNNRKKEFAAFRTAFGFPDGEPLVASQLPHREGWAILRKEESVEYGEQNRVSKWIAPKSGAVPF